MRIDVLTSGIWQTNTTILTGARGCIVVDPAYFPRELDAIAARAAELGGARAVVFTHGHWDHVMGHAALPGVPVWVQRGLVDAVAAGDPRAAAYLADAREFDSRWYVPRPEGHRWPADLRGVDEGEVELGGLVLRAVHLTGHSPDGLGLVAGGVLLPGDHLSPCEIPFVDDARAYRVTLDRLLELLAVVHEVVPGHGPRLTAAEAIAIAHADRAYLDCLLDAAARGDRDGALAITLPRAADVVGMADHHRTNCVKLGLGPSVTSTAA